MLRAPPRKGECYENFLCVAIGDVSVGFCGNFECSGATGADFKGGRIGDNEKKVKTLFVGHLQGCEDQKGSSLYDRSCWGVNNCIAEISASVWFFFRKNRLMTILPGANPPDPHQRPHHQFHRKTGLAFPNSNPLALLNMSWKPSRPPCQTVRTFSSPGLGSSTSGTRELGEAGTLRRGRTCPWSHGE